MLANEQKLELKDHSFPSPDTGAYYDYIVRKEDPDKRADRKRRLIHDSKPSPDFMRATLQDYRCDVDKILKKVLSTEELIDFMKAYVIRESDLEEEMERYADQILGGKRSKLELKLGSLFIRKGLDKVKDYLGE